MNVYNWADYIGSTTNATFQERIGIKVNYTLFATNEELFAKLNASPGQYDVVFPSDYMVKNLAEKGMLSPMDWSRIPNVENLLERFRPGQLPFDPEGKYAVPYHFGTCGIGYDATRVRVAPTSFQDLLRPALAGRVAVLDDMRYTMGAALKSLGYSANTRESSELDAAADLLRRLKQNLREFNSTTYHEMLARGELDMVFGYSAGILQAAATNPNIRYVIPSEGAMLWLDSMVIPKDAPHQDAAHQYVNFIIDPQVGAEITRTVRTATPNGAARELLPPELLADRAVFPTDEELEKAEFVENLGEAVIEYERRWSQLKR